MKRKLLAISLAAACFLSGYSELPERLGGVSETAVAQTVCDHSDHSYEEQHEAVEITSAAPAVVTEEVTKTAEAGKTYAAVKNLKAACGNNYIKLTWTKNTAAKTYKLALYQDGKYKVLKSTAGTTLTAKSLKANTSYTLRVLAYNAKGKLIAYSNIKAKTYGTVKNLKASRSNSSIKVTWSKVTSAKTYKLAVYQNGKYKILKTTTGNTATATGLKANTSYKLRVLAYNAKGKLIAYNNITAKTYGTVKNLKASRSYNAIKLTWSKVSSAKTYKLALYKNGAYKVLKTTTGTSATATNLAVSTSYTLRVLAYNAKGTRIAYSNITAKTYGKIMNLKAAKGNTSLTLTWMKYPSAKTYKLAMLQNGKYKVLKSTTKNTATASGLKKNTSYTLRVLAYDAKGKLLAYNNITAKTPSITVGKVTNFTAKDIETSSVKLTWDKDTTAKGYRVYRKNGSSWKLIKTISNNTVTTLAVSSLKEGADYDFKIVSYNGSVTGGAVICCVTAKIDSKYIDVDCKYCIDGVCPHCNGKGKDVRDRCIMCSGKISEDQGNGKCFYCSGRGCDMCKKGVCKSCDGTGIVYNLCYYCDSQFGNNPGNGKCSHCHGKGTVSEFVSGKSGSATVGNPYTAPSGGTSGGTSGGSGSDEGMTCFYCMGSGKCSACYNGTCTICGGKGYKYVATYGTGIDGKVDCSGCTNGRCGTCGGSGRCTHCGGTGRR